MLKILNLFTRILNVIFSNGEKRLKFAIENIVYIALAVLCAWGAYKLIGNVSGILSAESCSAESAGMAGLNILGIIVCISTGIYTLVAGVASQAVLLVFSLIGTVISHTRGKNLVAFLIALISLGACAVSCLYLFGVI